MGQVFGNEVQGKEKAFYRDVFIEEAQREWHEANPK